MAERRYPIKILFFGKVLTFVKDYVIMNQEEINEELLECDKGNHWLKIIYEEDLLNGLGVSVKWCRRCGSVVVDGISDGRTYPGRGMKMIGPGLYQQFKK